MRFIQDMQPVNAVMIWNLAIGPDIADYVEAFAGRAIYSSLDLYSGFDQFQLEVVSRDLTALQTPVRLMCMMVVPMGGTNSVRHLANGVNTVFRDFIPQFTIPFIDDLPICGMCTEDLDDTEVYPNV